MCGLTEDLTLAPQVASNQISNQRALVALRDGEVSGIQTDYEWIRYMERGTVQQSIQGCRFSPKKVTDKGIPLIFLAIRVDGTSSQKANMIVIIDPFDSVTKTFKILTSMNAARN